MDKNTEERIIRYVDKSEEHRADIAGRLTELEKAVYALTLDVNAIKTQQKALKETVTPIAQFFDNMESVGRFARVMRAIIGWLVLVIGTVVVTYAVVTDSVKSR